MREREKKQKEKRNGSDARQEDEKVRRSTN
jgi:hypothetical protein